MPPAKMDEGSKHHEAKHRADFHDLENVELAGRLAAADGDHQHQAEPAGHPQRSPGFGRRSIHWNRQDRSIPMREAKRQCRPGIPEQGAVCNGQICRRYDARRDGLALEDCRRCSTSADVWMRAKVQDQASRSRVATAAFVAAIKTKGRRRRDGDPPAFVWFRNQPRVSEIDAPLNWLSARITTDCLLPRVVSEMFALKPGALATT